MLPIQGGGPPIGFLGEAASAMSTAQKQGLEDALSNYDVENLSDEDAASLVEAIKALEIQPGAELAAALGEAGIDARALAEQAGIVPEGAGEGRPDGGPPPPPPGGGQGPDLAAVEMLQEIVDTLLEAGETDEDADFGTALREAMEAAGLDTSGPILDYRV